MNTKTIYQREHDILFRYGKGLKPENQVGSDQVASFLKIFSDQAKCSLEEKARVNKEIVLLDHQIQEQRRILKKKLREAKGQVQIVIVAENNGQTELNLAYGMNISICALFKAKRSASG
jgi:hypothetical protein